MKKKLEKADRDNLKNLEKYPMPLCTAVDVSNMTMEPKMNFRFLVQFPEGLGFAPNMVQKVSRPKFKDSKWQNIEIEFIDFIGPSTSLFLIELIKYVKEKEVGDILFDFYIHALDPVGCIIETWKIEAKEFSVDFGEYNYAVDGMQNCKLIVTPYKCTLIN